MKDTKTMARNTLILAPLVCVAMGTCAQDLDRVLPEPVPQLVQAETEPPKNDAAEFLASINLASLEGETVLVESLKGVYFLQSQEEVDSVSPDSLDQAGADRQHFPELKNEDFDFVLSAFINKPMSAESIRRMLQAIRIYQRRSGRDFSIAYFPEQDITDGYLQIVLISSSFDGEIEVEGNRYFKDALYTRAIRQPPGGAIDRATLDEDIAWLNRNPFRSVSVVASPGETPGKTRLVIRARERSPLRVFVGANNTGTQSTTEERALAGFNWGNAFGLGHQMTLQATQDFDFDHSNSLSGSYGFDLPWRHSVNISGAYSETDAIVDDPFSLKGRSYQIGVSYALPLAEGMGGKLSQSATMGFDFKSTDNNFDFADVPITDNLIEVVQMKAQYSGSLADAIGTTTASISVTAAPGGITSRNNDDFFEISRAGASADYVYANLSLSRNMRLSGVLENWQWQVSSRLQWANQNLVGSEQFGAGGVNSVRGYEEGEVFGDKGFLFTQEIQAPGIRLFGRASDTFADSLRIYAFQDYAETRSVNKLPGEDSTRLHSVGLGLRYQLATQFSLNAAWGVQLRDSRSSNTGDNSNLHLSAQISF